MATAETHTCAGRLEFRIRVWVADGKGAQLRGVQLVPTRPLDSTDVPQVLARYWKELGLTYDSHRPSDAESVVTIVRITGGNFRLIKRLMSQVARIMKINHLDAITPDAIEAAREVLVVGA